MNGPGRHGLYPFLPASGLPIPVCLRYQGDLRGDFTEPGVRQVRSDV